MMWRFLIFLLVKFSVVAANQDDALVDSKRNRMLNCIEFDLNHLTNFTSSLNLTDQSLIKENSSDSESFDLPLFGSLQSDWDRLINLHNNLPENSLLQGKLKKLFRLLAVAYVESENSFKESFNDENSSKSIDFMKSVDIKNDDKIIKDDDDDKSTDFIDNNTERQVSNFLRLNLSIELDKEKVNKIFDNLTISKNNNSSKNSSENVESNFKLHKEKNNSLLKNKFINDSMVQDTQNKIELEKIFDNLKKDILKNLTVMIDMEKKKNHNLRLSEENENKNNQKFLNNSITANSSILLNSKISNETITKILIADSNNHDEKLKINIDDNRTTETIPKIISNIPTQIDATTMKNLNTENKKNINDIIKNEGKKIDYSTTPIYSEFETSTKSFFNRNSSEEMNALQRLIKNDLNNNYYNYYNKKINSTTPEIQLTTQKIKNKEEFDFSSTAGPHVIENLTQPFISLENQSKKDINITKNVDLF